MMTKCSDDELKMLDKVVMIWQYYSDIADKKIQKIAQRFIRNGIKVMEASSFRCSDYNVMQGYPIAKNRILLRFKHKKAMEILDRVRPEMQEKLKFFLIDKFVAIFNESRFFMIDYLKCCLQNEAHSKPWRCR